MSLIPLTSPQSKAWNEAYLRLCQYLKTYRLTNEIHTSELSLYILSKAVELHDSQPNVSPTTLTLNLARKMLSEWFYGIIKNNDISRHQLMPSGHIALLLSHLPQEWPTAFLSKDLPGKLDTTMKQALMITGPTLDVSSMTPRSLDYGPLLEIARQTWHQWSPRSFLLALFFWAGVYVILYCSIMAYLYHFSLLELLHLQLPHKP